MKALELRKQEVRLQPQRYRQDTDTGSDTEVRHFKQVTHPDNCDETQNLPDLLSRGEKEDIIKSSSNQGSPNKPPATDFSSSIHRSRTFANKKFGIGKEPTILSKSKSFAVSDFKSSAPFEEKLSVFGAKGRSGERRSSNLATLLKSDMKESQKCKQDGEIDEEKYIDKSLVQRRESLRKTNALNPKTLEFQSKTNLNEMDRHKFNFLVVKNFSPSPSPERRSSYSPTPNQSSYNPGDDDSNESDSKDDSDIDEFFQNLNMEEDEVAKLTEKFDEVTKSNSIILPKVEIKIDPETVTVDSDIEEFFDKLDLAKEEEGEKKMTEKDVAEILNLFDDKPVKEGDAVEDLEKCFDDLAQELSTDDDEKEEDVETEPPLVEGKRKMSAVEKSFEELSQSLYDNVDPESIGSKMFPTSDVNMDREKFGSVDKSFNDLYHNIGISTNELLKPFPIDNENIKEIPPVRPKRTKGSTSAGGYSVSHQTGDYDNLDYDKPKLHDRVTIVQKTLPEPQVLKGFKLPTAKNSSSYQSFSSRTPSKTRAGHSSKHDGDEKCLLS